MLYQALITLLLTLLVINAIILIISIILIVKLVKSSKKANDKNSSQNIIDRTAGGIKGKLKTAKAVFWVPKLTVFGVMLPTIIIIACIYLMPTFYVMDKMAKVAALYQTLTTSSECQCYAKCVPGTDNSKTTYEMLFGEEEYNKFVKTLLWELALTDPDDLAKLSEQMISDEISGEAKQRFLKDHLTQGAVLCYANIVGEHPGFRKWDKKDRTNMTLAELETDLIMLLSDYKTDGVNKNCVHCGGLPHSELDKKCNGENHAIAGVNWEDLWRTEDDYYSEEDDDFSGSGDGTGHSYTGSGVNGGANGPYAIQLGNDGTFYWYHQSSENCDNNVDTPYGKFGSLWAGIKDGKKRSGGGYTSGRCCAIYTTAIMLSNLLGSAYTPYDVVTDLMGCTVQRVEDVYAFGATSDNGIDYNGDAGVVISYHNLATRINQKFNSMGVYAEVISFSKDTVEGFMGSDDKICYILNSWGSDTGYKQEFKWYKLSGGHFMAVRKMNNEGGTNMFYGFTSCCSLYNGSAHDKAATAMTQGITWDTMKAYARHGSGMVIYRTKSSIHTDEDDDGSGAGTATGGGQQTWDSSSAYIPLSNTNIEKGEKTSSYITINSSEGKNLYLYNGLPWECTDRANSYLVVIDAQERAWRDSFKAVTGHEYKNNINGKNSLHSDTADKLYKNYPGVPDSPQFIWNYDGVDCFGLVIIPSWLKHSINWGAISISSTEVCSHKYCLVLERGGQFYYAPAIASGGKGHTWPGGCFQTYYGRSNDSTFYWPATDYAKRIFNMSGSGEWTTTTSLTQAEVACLIEDGVHNGNQINTYIHTSTAPGLRVQQSIEGFFKSGKNSLNGFNVYGVIVYSTR